MIFTLHLSKNITEELSEGLASTKTEEAIYKVHLRVDPTFCFWFRWLLINLLLLIIVVIARFWGFALWGITVKTIPTLLLFLLLQLAALLEHALRNQPQIDIELRGIKNSKSGSE